MVAAGVLAPAVRKRLKLKPPVVLGAAAAAPVALSVAMRRSHARDVLMCLLQMWAYVAGYEMPADDPEAQGRRVHIDYPVRVDRALGLGVTPTERLQRAFSTPRRFSRFEKTMVWCHWMWFAVPHGTILYVLVRRPERFPRAAAMTYATFDLGLIGYWALPTAPPWYAAQHGRFEDGETPPVRRMMSEYGEQFWEDRWESLYSSLGGNSLAAMPSLHFATSLMAARLLADAGPVQGAVGAAYASVLGLALVYLGEHYVVDLLAGAALAEGVRRAAPRAAVAAGRFSRAMQALEAVAHRSSR